MRILLDTNVLMDYLTEREPFYQDARQIIMECKSKQCDGVVAAHSIVDMFYILRKHFTHTERREMMLAFLEILHVEAIDRAKLQVALENEGFTDFEDCLQTECAKMTNVDYIITRNVKDYTASETPVLTPTQFVEQFG